ncbi:bifunctional hydroxymethylpyrimidine kinase/phosphomethylpyrimidine kinase [Cohnella sp. CIP 111063]|uniref:bifunctional hydroxymethylpyrimidine kinase/phosphomethylpyrimidine kinase n=1 Tax=unclassified Cohnella TaxID=2636738 RepID=UPI000B8C32DC|nr:MULTISPECIES: bifunctional hydroxymethylpyrimidine kinase/phosphomethylpyrimidine kinase [unclassified Cohnella]OXS58440.1 bifunctional hydroxymethylpyrimidine kinase/phosphomethylpyrimidine kinase [Cohnella sp. CIP 111063]PRX71733.1 hydroxymethylpyrimidine/phosphomethylpyrimidine kinase [Cohnella sp. SGD-V74]
MRGVARSSGEAPALRRSLVLTVAGSDSGGGAGIQADLKTFQELGVYGMSVVTAVTAQNSLGVQRVEAVSPDMVEAQLESVLSDIGADAVKTGMLPQSAHVETAASSFARHRVKRLVVDPVCAASDGSALMDGGAFEAMKRLLLPMAEVVTPNLPEACRLLGVRSDDIRTIADMERLAKRLLSLGSRHVFLKGGHWNGEEAVDVFVSAHRPEEARRFTGPRYPTLHTHGTGCTTASAIAALLAQGALPEEACREAKAFVAAAISEAFSLGGGTGSLWHGAFAEKRRVLR